MFVAAEYQRKKFKIVLLLFFRNIAVEVNSNLAEGVQE